MIRLLQIVVFCCAVALLTGCPEPEENRPIWEDIKISDLSATSNEKQIVERLQRATSFSVWIFEVPAENVGELDGVWQILEGSNFAKDNQQTPQQTRPLLFNDYDAFGANSFLVGFSRAEMWNKVRSLLIAADGRRAATVSLFFPEAQSDDIEVAKLDEQKTIFYTATGGSMEGASLGPGSLALRIKARKIPGSRGVSYVDAQPVFTSLPPSPIPELAAREKSHDFIFTSTGFHLKMSPGDFILLGPERYISHQVTLGSLFFSKIEPRPVVRMFLIVCTGMNY